MVNTNPNPNQVINTLCQGSAADLIKRAMLAIDAALVPAEGGSSLHRAETGRLLLQVAGDAGLHLCGMCHGLCYVGLPPPRQRVGPP